MINVPKMNSSADAENYYRSIEPEIQETVKAIDLITNRLGEPLEGNCFYVHKTNDEEWFFIFKRINYANVMKTFKIKNMIEIGFNAGHSAAVFLAAMDKDSSYICFDLGNHLYSKPCFDFLQSKYPQVKEYIQGDSKETMKKMLLDNPSYFKTFDCIHIDGGHDTQTARSDIEIAHLLLKSGGILILDDTQMPAISFTIPSILKNGYRFVLQIPTFGYSHVVFQKL